MWRRARGCVMKWPVIENIAIYALITIGIIVSKTGWPLVLLLCVNYSPGRSMVERSRDGDA